MYNIVDIAIPGDSRIHEKEFEKIKIEKIIIRI